MPGHSALSDTDKDIPMGPNTHAAYTHLTPNLHRRPTHPQLTYTAKHSAHTRQLVTSLLYFLTFLVILSGRGGMTWVSCCMSSAWVCGYTGHVTVDGFVATRVEHQCSSPPVREFLCELLLMLLCELLLPCKEGREDRIAYRDVH